MPKDVYQLSLRWFLKLTGTHWYLTTFNTYEFKTYSSQNQAVWLRTKVCQGKDPRRFAVVIAAKGALINYEVKGFNTFHFIKMN